MSLYYEEVNQLEVGTEFYQERAWTGLVKFEVTSINNGVVKVKSVSATGYDMELTNEQVKQLTESGKYLYKTLDGGKDDIRAKEEARQQEVMDKYMDDKEAFAQYAVKLAYQSKMDAEHGDYAIGSAILELAHKHYPELDVYE